MQKKIIWIGISFAAILLLILSLLFSKSNNSSSSPVYAIIPKNATAIFHSHDFKKSLNKTTASSIIWEELKNTNSHSKDLVSQINFFDSLTTTKEIANSLHSNEIYISLHSIGGNSYNLAYYLQMDPSLKERDIIDLLNNHIIIEPYPRSYKEINIYSVNTKSLEKVHFIIQDGKLAICYKNEIIESIIDQIKSPTNLSNDPSFIQMLETSGHQAVGHIYTHPSAFFEYIKKRTISPAGPTLDQLKNFSSWIALDLLVGPNNIRLSGFTLTHDSSYHLLNNIKEQSPIPITLQKIVPDNASLVYWYGISNTQSFYSSNTEKSLSALIGNEVVFCQTPKHEYQLITTNAPQIFKEQVLLKKEDPINYNGHEIFKSKKINLDKLIGFPFKHTRGHYFLQLNNEFVFCRSVDGAKKFIQKNNRNETIHHHAAFVDQTNNLSKNSTVFIYSDLSQSSSPLKDILKKDTREEIQEVDTSASKFSSIGIQINGSNNNLFYSNIFLKYASSKQTNHIAIWEKTLDTTTTFTPYIFRNHHTNEKEIFLQDDNNTLYLFSHKGNLLWKKPFNEKITSKVFSVDKYKNKKLQLLFSTKNHIFLLDRKGENVEDFPVKLSAEAANGVTVFDYDNNKKYRILIATKDQQVHNYTIDGKKVKGWDYKSTTNNITSPIWHCSFKKKDYLVMHSEKGKIKIIARNGNDRLKISSLLPLEQNTFFIKGKDLKNSFLCNRDSNNTIVNIYLNDIIQKTHIPEIKRAFVPTILNNRPVYFTSTDSSIVSYNMLKEQILSYTSLGSVNSIHQINNQYLLSTTESNSTIHSIDGKNHSTPIQNTTNAVCITKLIPGSKKDYFICTSKDKVIAHPMTFE